MENRKVKNRKTDSIVVYFDIFAFSSLMEIRGEKAMRFLETVPDWINRNLKVDYKYLFSDCGFLIYEIKEDNRNEKLKKCHDDVELLATEYLNNDFFLRGSITYGEVQLGSYYLIGEPVFKAVELESNYCPGPFIIFPYDQYKKGNFNEVSLEFKEIYTKGEKGVMRACLIYPLDKQKYRNKICEYFYEFTKRGKYEYAKVWYKSLKIVKSLLK